MGFRKYIIGLLVVILTLALGCIDGGNPLSTGPKEVSVDLSTPEGVIEAYWKYIDVGKYDEVYDLFCDDTYFNQIKGSGVSKNYYSKESFMDYIVSAYGENGEKIDSGSPKVTGKYSLTGRGAREYGVDDIVEEGYDVGCEAGRYISGANLRGGGIVVKYNGRWCIASE